MVFSLFVWEISKRSKMVFSFSGFSQFSLFSSTLHTSPGVVCKRKNKKGNESIKADVKSWRKKNGKRKDDGRKRHGL
jgi:hypothetical protein